MSEAFGGASGYSELMFAGLPSPACSARDTFEPLSLADVPAVFDLYSRCAGYFLLQDGELAVVHDADELFTDVPPTKRPEDQHVLGYRVGKRLEAVAAVLTDYPEPGHWYLGLLLVAPERRSQGLGRKLYASIEQRSIKHGATRMLLAVLKENESALRFWRSLGFEIVRTVEATTFKQKAHMRYELARRLGNVDPEC